MTLAEWLTSASQRLTPFCPHPARTARRFAAHALGMGENQIFSHDHAPFPPEDQARAEHLLARFLAGEPTAYILEEQEFFGRPFYVSPATLIPRPETEHLVEEALRLLPPEPLTFLDAGTGSGCIALTLCAERPLWSGVALDISRQALDVAEKNADRLGLKDRVVFAEADFTQPELAPFLAAFAPTLCPGKPASFDLILANPPYISAAEWETDTAPDVKIHEPKHALLPVAGFVSHPQNPTGLEHLKALVRMAENLLAPSGYLLMEHGFKQGAACRALCHPKKWQSVRTGRDLAGQERFLCAKRLAQVC